MDKKIFTTRVRTNLSGVLQMTQTIEGIMMTGDNAANQIIVELYGEQGKETIPDTATIIGYFIRGDGYTVEVTGEVEDGNAKVVIPEVVYEVSGSLSIAIRLLEDPHEVIIDDVRHIVWDTKMVIAALSCFIQLTETNSIIDPGHVIPDVQELLQYIDILNQEREDIATEEGLRVIAEQGRVAAETLRQEEFEDIMDDLTTSEATRQTNETARQTNEATRQSNETTRISNETTRQTQETARQQAQAARNAEIDNMTVAAQSLNPYDPPTVTISEVSGHKHILFGLTPGDPFVIAKTFASVAEMQAYTGTDVRVGQFVVISSNEEDPDNAKMYVKTSSGWSFITDLSGAQGIQGPRGYTGNGISSVVLNQDYTITVNYTDSTSWTSTNSVRGVQGETGNGIAMVEENQDYTLTITMTDGTSYVTDPVKGETGDTGNGIASAVMNQDYTLTITFTNGTVYTTPPLKGEPGAAGTSFNYDSGTQELVITYF